MPQDVEREREAKVRARFPGARSLSLVKIVRWAERTPGPCLADFEVSPGASLVDVHYETGNGDVRLESVSPDALLEHGWLPGYRTPAGIGFEKVAEFREIDLTMADTIVCRCFGQERIEETHPTRFRFVWAEGEHPQVSLVYESGGRSIGVTPAVTAGKLVTYDFPVTLKFPGKNWGECRAHVALTIYVDPPLL